MPQRYACRTCGDSKWLPAHPTDGPYSVRTGCEPCGRITRHTAVGRVPSPQQKD